LSRKEKWEKIEKKQNRKPSEESEGFGKK